jgi:putative nucleotidyltransferase with HDIG domain
MGTLWSERDYDDDPIVRKTVRRLRLSVFAVVVGIAVCASLAAAIANQAFEDGKTAAMSTIDMASATPQTMTWVLLFGGFLTVGSLMFILVSRPYASARSHASELAHAYRTLETSTLETFAALNATVEAKDRYTAGHGLRVTLISMLIAQELEMDEVEVDTLRHAATFHDIGKIAIPDAILGKPGVLSDAEFELMKSHATESARICGKIAALREAVPMIRHHHERYDGRGYPDALAGRNIPVGARIISVADTWDAITSDRPYRPGQPATVALDEIRRVAGTQLDKMCVNAFLSVLSKDPWMFGLVPEDLERFPAAPDAELPKYSRSAADVVEIEFEDEGDFGLAA